MLTKRKWFIFKDTINLNTFYQNPVPNSKWKGVLRTTEDAPTCTQDTEQIPYIGSEDCLYINVYTPKVCRKRYKKH